MSVTVRTAGGPFVDSRHELSSPPATVDAAEEDLEQGGMLPRKLMGRSLALAVGGLGVPALFPIRALGPRPGRDLAHTPWHDGLRLVTDDGRLVRAGDVPVEGLVTVFPEGDPGSADGQAVLIRVTPGLLVATADARTGRRVTSSPTRRSAPADLFGQAVDNLRLCTAHGVVHGDLSPYNLLVWGGRSYFIDFPQAVDPVAHPDGLQLLECDVFTCASGRGATVYMRPGRALRRADGGRV